MCHLHTKLYQVAFLIFTICTWWQRFWLSCWCRTCIDLGKRMSDIEDAGYKIMTPKIMDNFRMVWANGFCALSSITLWALELNLFLLASEREQMVQEMCMGNSSHVGAWVIIWSYLVLICTLMTVISIFILLWFI